MLNYGPVLSDDTKPHRRAPKPRRALRWILIVLIAVAGIALVVVLVLPFLQMPPPVAGPAYELPIVAEANASLDPARDALLESADRIVAVYVPAGAYPAGGTLVLQSRRADLVPFQSEGRTDRIFAVDLLVLGPEMQVVSPAEFAQAILVCFRIDENLDSLRRADPTAVVIQQFDERPEVLAWADQVTGPGWEERMLCTGTTHLSLFALAITFPDPSTATPSPSAALSSPTATPTSTPTATPARLYGVPGLP
jgi:hypothetical protein